MENVTCQKVTNSNAPEQRTLRALQASHAFKTRVLLILCSFAGGCVMMNLVDQLPWCRGEGGGGGHDRAGCSEQTSDASERLGRLLKMEGKKGAEFLFIDPST